MKKIIITKKYSSTCKDNSPKKIHGTQLLSKFEIGGNRQDAQNLLTFLFELPEKVFNILNTYPEKLDARESAKIYLLTKLKDIKHLLVSDIDSLNDLIDSWLEKKHVYNRLSFEESCIISENCKFITIPTIGRISFKDPSLVRQIKKSWKFPKPGFDLVLQDKRIFLEVIYIPNNQTEASSHQNIKTHINEFGWGAKAKQLFKAFGIVDKQNIAAAKNLSVVDWNRLEGKSVPGGAPTLSKR